MNVFDIPPLVAYEKEALAAISSILRANRKLIIAYSGGKDSTAVLLMALNAARQLREEGVTFPSILITHGDTGIENPTVVALVRKELKKAIAFGHQHGFGVQAEIARPILNDTWAVSILSGRKLPTFANSSTRDCTVMFKISPMERLRNRILKIEKGQSRGGPPVTLIGTRFEESDGRATRMTERGETAYTPWEKEGAWFMSPIANWTSDDVWEYIGEYKNKKLFGFTDGQAVWDMYADAGATGTCAVVADMATESLKKSRACGARFGCALCAAVGRDKSLENMLLQPQFDYLRHLNRIQRFIVDTQWDWSRRNWVGRTVTNGYIKIEPDAYSPAMLQELLRYCLTADYIEEQAAYRMGIAPRFKLVSQEQLLAIDALWSINGIQEKAFTAVNIWKEVYEDKKKFFPPKIEPVKRTPMPKARYLKVGPNWDSDNPSIYSGLRDVLQEGFAGPGCVGTRTLEDGRIIANVAKAPSFSFDPEAVDMFFQFEMEFVLRNFHERAYSNCTAGFMHYVRLNMVATSESHIKSHVDRILRRTSWKHRNGLIGTVNPEDFLPKTVSKAEMLKDIRATQDSKVTVVQSLVVEEGDSTDVESVTASEKATDIELLNPEASLQGAETSTVDAIPPDLLLAKPYQLALHLA
jgi:3'-phosphoadenosine 5'-phosphosulfate sulfotransferase (PAPS reductase)/FAD synthetase